MLIENTLATIYLTEEEYDAIETVYGICLKLTRAFPTARDIQSISTGEIIILEELPRVRGILNALMESSEWRPR